MHSIRTTANTVIQNQCFHQYSVILAMELCLFRRATATTAEPLRRPPTAVRPSTTVSFFLSTFIRSSNLFLLLLWDNYFIGIILSTGRSCCSTTTNTDTVVADNGIQSQQCSVVRVVCRQKLSTMSERGISSLGWREDCVTFRSFQDAISLEFQRNSSSVQYPAVSSSSKRCRLALARKAWRMCHYTGCNRIVAPTALLMNDRSINAGWFLLRAN